MKRLADTRLSLLLTRIPLIPVLICMLASFAFANLSFILGTSLCALFILTQVLNFNWRFCLLSIFLSISCFIPQYHSHLRAVEGQRIMQDYSQSGVEVHIPLGQVLSVKETRKGFSSIIITKTRDAHLISTPTSFRKNTRLQLYTDIPLREGSLITLRGRLAPAHQLNNFGEFDWESYYLKQRIIGAIHAEEIQISQKATWKYHAASSRDKMRQLITNRLLIGVPSESDATWIIPALTLGVSPVDGEIDKFKNAGVMHLFVVSGLHVGLVFSIAWITLYFSRLRTMHVLSLCLIIVWGYIFITGLEAPAVRAGLITTFLILAFILKRRVNAWNSLIAAYLVILVFEQNAIMDVGVLLSFGVVSVLILLVQRAVKLCSTPVTPDPFLPRQLWSDLQLLRLNSCRWGIGIVIVAIVSWITSSIITAISFGRVYTFGILSSLMLFPFAFSMMVMSAASLAIGALHPPMSIPLNRLNAALAEKSFSIVGKVDDYPHSIWCVNDNGYNDSLTIFNLPKGAAALYLNAGEGILIDCGRDWMARSIILPCLEQSGQRVDTIFLSHKDTAHTGGSSEFPLATIIHSYDLPAQVYHYDQVQIETIPLPSTDSSSADDNVALIKITTPTQTIGYLSDAGLSTFQQLSWRKIDFSCDVLIAGNHGKEEDVIDDFIHYSGAKKVIFLKSYFHTSPYKNTHTYNVFQDQSGATQLRIKK